MKFSSKITASLAATALLASQGSAFSVRQVTSFRPSAPSTSLKNIHTRPLRSSVQDDTEREQTAATTKSLQQRGEKTDDEIHHLQSMAAKYRAEAAKLEADRANEKAKAVEKAFQKWDLDNDGEISLGELKDALEKTFKMDLPEDRVKKLMDDLDSSGDGKLQKDEFVDVQQFRNKLEALAQSERKKALDAQKESQRESEVSKFLEAQRDMINDSPPTNADKVLSTLPYLFPFIDGLLFGQYLLGNSDNPLVSGLAGLYVAYRSIPLSGFLSFFALSILSSNVSINRLVRFNMLQAIFLDIALFVPGLVGALAGAASSGLGYQIPPGVGELGSDAIFLAMIAAVGYSTVSSLLGETPDKIPFISNAVNNRMPSVDMFEPGGRFDPRRFDEGDKKENDKENDED